MDAHLLFGAGATALFTARGCALYAREGVLANRCFGDLLDERGALRLLAPRGAAAGTKRISFRAARALDAGWAQYESGSFRHGHYPRRDAIAEDGTLFLKPRLKKQRALRRGKWN